MRVTPRGKKGKQATGCEELRGPKRILMVTIRGSMSRGFALSWGKKKGWKDCFITRKENDQCREIES